ncbi:MAG TPA: hypothetical protein VEV43_06995 [Actinomycetota bacterium]|nr:hypothetical protein [Actinomycetota bacterium]
MRPFRKRQERVGILARRHHRGQSHDRDERALAGPLFVMYELAILALRLVREGPREECRRAGRACVRGTA